MMWCNKLTSDDCCVCVCVCFKQLGWGDSNISAVSIAYLSNRQAFISAFDEEITC